MRASLRCAARFLESHFRWQIRTFWYAMLLALIVWAVSLALMLVLIGFVTCRSDWH